MEWGGRLLTDEPRPRGGVFICLLVAEIGKADIRMLIHSVTLLDDVRNFTQLMVASISHTMRVLFLSAAIATSGASFADDRVFEIDEVSRDGRVVSAQFADFDGDGREDLMVATLTGIPPEEQRNIRVHLQDSDGSYPTDPSHVVPVPARSAVFDIADVKDVPGEELVLLRPDAITILSIADTETLEWNIPVEGPSTVAAAEDERGFDSFKLVYEMGPEPLILVPQIGLVSILTVDGSLMGQVDVGSRANYFVARRPSILSVESDLQLYLDTPKLSIGDVDGDERADIVAATRHEIRVFLRRPDGRFEREPSYAHALKLISPRDHSRGSGSVVTTARDVDDDGLLDLVITHVEGTFSDTVTTSYFYRNRDGRWDLENPDDQFVSEGAFSSDLLLDIDGDDIDELIRIQFKFSVLELVEILLTRKIDSVIAVHRLLPNGRFDTKPSSRRKFSTGISFETFRPNGFMPQAGIDVNADGFMDVVTSANGKGLEIYLGTENEPFTRRTSKQKMATTGRIHFADYNDDGLLDFVLFDPQSFDAPVQIGRNLGVLPNSKANSN